MTLQLSWLEPLGPKAPPRPLLQFMLHRLCPLQTQIPTTHGLADIENPQTAGVVNVVPWTVTDNTLAIQSDDTIVVADATFTPTMIRLSPPPPPGLNPQNCLTHYHHDWNWSGSTESYHCHRRCDQNEPNPLTLPRIQKYRTRTLFVPQNKMTKLRWARTSPNCREN